MSGPHSDLFASNAPRPLADRLRPSRLSDIVGQDHLLGPDGALIGMLGGRPAPSIILWGPPGTGKTTMAGLIAEETNLVFESLSAVFSGIADVRRVFDRAVDRRRAGLGTLLFVDEIHRFNKAQQDGFLPFVEDGTVVLVGATTENPSFEINAALLSRCRVLVLNRLDEEALEALLRRAEADFGEPLPLETQARSALKALADGDGRYLLNMVEAIARKGTKAPLAVAELSRIVGRRAPLYDKGGEAHYNLISAFHKSLRGSDPDAALYWLARMLDGGEDPGFIARRMTRFASEDIGLADPNALPQAISAWEAHDRLGSPEGELALFQCAIYLATAPKSNAAYKAEKSAKSAARETGSLAPPAHGLNAPTRLTRDLGHGEGYVYDHDTEDGFAGLDYFPDGMARSAFYRPGGRGFEVELQKRLDFWALKRREK